MNKGEVITFNYDGGSTPGAVRLVLVEDVKATHIRGYDFEKLETRNFTKKQIRNSSAYDASKIRRLDLDQLPSGALVHNIQTQYATDGFKTRIFDGEIVAVKPPMPKKKQEVTRYECFSRLEIESNNGNRVTLDLNDYDSIDIYFNGKYVGKKYTDLIDQLAKL